MLSLLKIKNIALIDELQLEFSQGLNLLTGETGSGKSIIVDSLGALTGDLPSRATACLEAGCDLALACSGRIEDAHVQSELHRGVERL